VSANRNYGYRSWLIDSQLPKFPESLAMKATIEAEMRSFFYPLPADAGQWLLLGGISKASVLENTEDVRQRRKWPSRGHSPKDRFQSLAAARMPAIPMP
jgi:hypothetical protein